MGTNIPNNFLKLTILKDEKSMNDDRKTKKKRAHKVYTKGELNKLIDGLCDPLFETNEGFILVDGLLHGLVEQNPPLTIRKFMKHNLPKLIEQIKKKTNP